MIWSWAAVLCSNHCCDVAEAIDPVISPLLCCVVGWSWRIVEGGRGFAFGFIRWIRSYVELKL